MTKSQFLRIERSRLSLLQVGMAIAVFASMAPAIAEDSRTETAAIPFRCEDSVVTKTGYYFENQPDSGIYAVFQSKLGVESFSDATSAVTDRGMPLNPVMAKQKVGDKVQVCLVSYPASDRYCNPNKDPRGRYYRVYNYRLKAAYVGTNSNHLCGGA